MTQLQKKTQESKIVEANRHLEAAFQLCSDVIEKMPDTILVDRSDQLNRNFDTWKRFLQELLSKISE